MPIKNVSSTSSEKTSTNMPKVNISKAGVVKFLMIIVFLGALASSGYFYYQYSQVKDAAEVADVKKTIESVRKLMRLPENEVPTVATVTDKTKLKDQPFFQAAENGDKVVIFKSIKKAILYRPSLNKIVDITPVNTEAAERSAQNTQNSAVLGADARAKNITSTPAPTPDENAIYKVALLNGSSKQGATSDIETKMADVKKIEVATKDNAQKEYEDSSIIMLNQNAAVQGQELAEALGYEIGSNLPEGETAPAGSDIVIIIGANDIQ